MLTKKQIFELYLDKLYEYDSIGRGVVDIALECEIALLEHILGVDEIRKFQSASAEVDTPGAKEMHQQILDADTSEGGS
jgi:hypothetical protein